MLLCSSMKIHAVVQVLIALLTHHAHKDNLEALVNTIYSGDFNPILWDQKRQQAEEFKTQLVGVPRNQVCDTALAQNHF